MGKNKKNKLKKKNHNAPKIGNEMTKNLDKHTHSPTYEEIKSSSPNRNIIKLNTIPNNIEITNLIIKKISNFGKATKKWCQIETKNIMNLIKAKKKQLITQILISTKSACTKLLDAKEIDLKRPTQSKDTKFNITRPKTIKQENNILNKKSLMSPISQSSPYTNNNEIIQQRNISELLENTPKVFTTDTTPSSIKRNNQQNNTSKINIKCNTSQQSTATPIQAPQQLMSLITKPSRQLEDLLKNTHEKSESTSDTILNKAGKGRYRGGVVIEENFTVTYDSDLITESQTSINMSKLRAINNYSNERGFAGLSNIEDSETQNQEEEKISVLLSEESVNSSEYSIIIEEGGFYYETYNDTYDDRQNEMFNGVF